MVVSYKSITAVITLIIFVSVILLGCTGSTNNEADGKAVTKVDLTQIDEQPSRVFYEVFVRSFYDTNGDGIGDLNGVTAKLDYIKSLGIGGIWLMPINPSPTYHGYDVTDYYGINSDYGTLEDFKNLLDEAHRRDIVVIMDLVVNHTSKQHPWFKDAIASSKSKYRNWYTIKKATAKVEESNPWGANPWHISGSDKYLGVFWEGMPDLNFDNKAVRKEMNKIATFWLEQGVDGFRLDAAKHIYGDFQSTIYKPKTQKKNVAFWEQFRDAVNKVNPNAYLVGEVWDEPIVVAPYLKKAFNSGFNFSIADKIVNDVSKFTDPNLGGLLDPIYENYRQSSNDQFVDAIFLANHDQDRVMSRLFEDEDAARLAAAMYLTLPGNPFIYYGEELGMRGMKPDEQIREPLPWYKDEDRMDGQTYWEYSQYRTAGVSVEEQDQAPGSLLNFYRTIIGWRNEIPALRNGGIDVIDAKHSQVTAYARMTQDQRVVVIHNLTPEARVVEWDAAEFGPLPASLQIIKFTKPGAKIEGNQITLPALSTIVVE